MKQLLEKIDKFSFIQITSGMVLLGIIFFLPVGIWIFNQPTKITSKAAPKSTPVPSIIIKRVMPIAAPRIDKISPFLGKVGDEIAIEGTNFGIYPLSAKIFIGNIEIVKIGVWENTQIVCVIPERATSGIVSLSIGNWTTSYDRILTIYDKNTQVKVTRNHQKLIIHNSDQVSKVQFWPELGSLPQTFKNKLNSRIWEIDLAGGQLEWINIYDKDDVLIPFWINPAQF